MAHHFAPATIVAEYVTLDMQFKKIVRSTESAIAAWFAAHPDCIPVGAPTTLAKTNANGESDRVITIKWCPAWGKYTVEFSDCPNGTYQTDTVEDALDTAHYEQQRHGGTIRHHGSLKYAVRF